MAEVSSHSRLFGWIFLVGSAVLAADLVCAGMERHLQVSPRPFEAAPAQRAETPRAPSEAGLKVVLRQPEAALATPGSSASPRASSSPGASAFAGPPSGLSLQGTLVAGEASVAFLEASGKATAVGLDQEVAGYRVTHIGSTWVALSQGDKVFQLEMDTVKEGRPAATPAPAAVPAAQTISSAASPVVPAPTESRLSLEDIRSQLDNASSMAQQVRVIPKARDGQTYGVLLEFRQPDNLMAKLGLQHGDVLLAVNDSPIRGAEDLYKAYMTLRNAEALEFQVERGDKVTPVRYELTR